MIPFWQILELVGGALIKQPVPSGILRLHPATVAIGGALVFFGALTN